MDNKLPTAIDEFVGRQIRLRREELGMSQGALAEELGVTFQQLQKYENGTNRVSAGRLHDLAVVLKTTIAYFFQGQTPRTARGVAEPGAEFDAGPDAELIELMKAYRAIDDPAARKSLLATARKLARGSKRQAPKKHRKSGR